MVSTRIIDSEPGMILEGERKSLVISDLHIGFEDKFSSNKITSRENSASIYQYAEERVTIG